MEGESYILLNEREIKKMRKESKFLLKFLPVKKGNIHSEYAICIIISLILKINIILSLYFTLFINVNVSLFGIKFPCFEEWLTIWNGL